MLLILRTKDQLEQADTGYGFFGEARKLLGGKQATTAYNCAIKYLMGEWRKTSTNEMVAFLDSKNGRWWAEQLNDSLNYHDVATAYGAVVQALADSKIKLAKARAELSRERTAWMDTVQKASGRA